jgi:Cu/Ag efflux pump CusA
VAQSDHEIPQTAARFGIYVADIQDAIQTAVKENAVSQVLIGDERYDVAVRYQRLIGEPRRRWPIFITR